MADTILEFKDASIFQGLSLVLSDVNVQVNRGDFVYLIEKAQNRYRATDLSFV